MPPHEVHHRRIRPLRLLDLVGVPGALDGHIVFEDVWFEYAPDTPVLKGISFEAKPGTTTALVGSSGSGKSTLIGLVMAFHRPKSGRISVDGRDLNDLKLRGYRDHLGLVQPPAVARHDPLVRAQHDHRSLQVEGAHALVTLEPYR